MSIFRHTTYNLMGAVLPLAVTLVTVPLYLEIVGIERYGALAICWAVLGYFGFLDLGLGPAVAQKIASLAPEDTGTAERVFWSAAWLSLAAGLLGTILFYAGTALYFLLGELGSPFQAEFRDAVPLMGAILPAAMMSSVAGGALHGRQRFLAINLISTTSSTLMSSLPLLLAYFWAPTLKALVAGALLARLFALLLQYWSCRKAVPLSMLRLPNREFTGGLLKFGGWVTVSSAVAPLLLTVDRLAIAAMLGAAAVAAYSIPFSLISRMSIIPSSLASALYPRFAGSSPEERSQLLTTSIAAIAVVTTPVCILAIAGVGYFFTLWLGEELASISAPLAHILIIGAWINGLAYVPYGLLQGSGRPDIITKIHLSEILPYWAALALSMLVLGLQGAAIAWTSRVAAECVLLLWKGGMGGGRLWWLLMPLILLLGAAGAAAVGGAAGYAMLALLFLLSIGWSLAAMPEALRQLLQRFLPFQLPSFATTWGIFPPIRREH